MTNLADLNRRQGNLKDAATRFAEVLELRRRVLGPDHPNTLSVVTSLAAVKFDQRDYADVEGLLRAALAGYERRNVDNWQRYYAQSLLGVRPPACWTTLDSGWPRSSSKRKRH